MVRLTFFLSFVSDAYGANDDKGPQWSTNGADISGDIVRNVIQLSQAKYNQSDSLSNWLIENHGKQTIMVL